MAEDAASPEEGEDFGHVPDGWRVVRLGQVADLCSGGTPSKQRPDFWDGKIPWASPKDLKRPRLADTEDHISEAGLSDGSRLVQAGAIFIVVRGMILARDVPVALAMVPMAFNQDMKAIVARSEIDSEFLLYGLSAYKSRLLHHIGSAAHGTKRISTSAIENFQLPMPPLAEQRAIAKMLRTVQQAKEATEKILVATRQLKQSLMRHLFTYGPVPFAQADRVAIKESEIGQVPEHWRLTKLGDIGRIGVTVHPSGMSFGQGKPVRCATTASCKYSSTLFP
jgi:type I restriction enzyme S subunit